MGQDTCKHACFLPRWSVAKCCKVLLDAIASSDMHPDSSFSEDRMDNVLVRVDSISDRDRARKMTMESDANDNKS